MIPALLDDRFVPARVAVEVVMHQPLPRGVSQVITGRLLGTMHARGRVHHFRVAVGDGVVYLAPPSWMTLMAVDEAHVGATVEMGASA